MQAVNHFAIGIFGDNDGPVHQHPDRKDQTEQNNDIDRHAQRPKDQDRRQERPRNGQTDQKSRPPAQRPDHHHHHQKDRQDHTVLKIGQHGADVG